MDWGAAHLTEAVARHQDTLYGNGKALTTRVTVLERDVKDMKEDVKHLIQWNHYIMAGLAIATLLAQFVIPKLLG